jgi:hypothetical protein
LPWAVRDMTQHQLDLILIHKVLDVDSVEDAKYGGNKTTRKMVDTTFDQKLKEAQQRGMQNMQIMESEVGSKVTEAQKRIAEQLKRSKG